ncbi:MAG: universal stress protein, partial [Thermodesulfobacteriota bacterium]|nr:universal stress protein [Thermodesulfobacteriota bacterium]
VVGRKGMSTLKEVVLGTVPAKLIEKLSSIPLVIVGKNPRPGSALLALDGSENSMGIVDYVENAFAGPDFMITLIHVIRGDDAYYLKEAEKNMKKVFDKAKARLIKSGFESSQVTTRIIAGAHSRAGAILEEAQKGGYGTIIVGRRGLSRVQEFFMGRVSSKVIQLAKGYAVCVVS